MANDGDWRADGGFRNAIWRTEYALRGSSSMDVTSSSGEWQIENKPLASFGLRRGITMMGLLKVRSSCTPVVVTYATIPWFSEPGGVINRFNKPPCKGRGIDNNLALTMQAKGPSEATDAPMEWLHTTRRHEPLHQFRHPQQTPNSLSFLSNMMLLVPVTRAGIYPRSLAWTEPSCRVLKLYLPFRWLMSLGLIPTKWLSFPCAYLVTFHPSFKSAMPLSFANFAAGSAWVCKGLWTC